MLGVGHAFYGQIGGSTAGITNLNGKSFCFDERMESVDLPHLSFSFGTGGQA